MTDWQKKGIFFKIILPRWRKHQHFFFFFFSILSYKFRMISMLWGEQKVKNGHYSRKFCLQMIFSRFKSDFFKWSPFLAPGYTFCKIMIMHSSNLYNKRLQHSRLTRCDFFISNCHMVQKLVSLYIHFYCPWPLWTWVRKDARYLSIYQQPWIWVIKSDLTSHQLYYSHNNGH